MRVYVQLPSTSSHAGAPHATSVAFHLTAVPTYLPHTAATSPCRFCRPPCHPLPDRCRFLPLLPPVTRNVKLPNRPTRLELPLCANPRLAHNLKNGKNGNVHCTGQLSIHILSHLSSSIAPSFLLLRKPPAPPFLRVRSRLLSLSALCVLCGSILSLPPCPSVSSVVGLRPSGWRVRIPAHIMGDAARWSAWGEQSRQPVNITRGHLV